MPGAHPRPPSSSGPVALCRDRLRALGSTGAALLFALVLPLAPACTSVAPVRRAEVQDLMDRQQAAWNRGDLRGFVSYYRQDESMTFVGKHGVTQGGVRLLEKYRQGYPDAASRGRLGFELLGLRPVGARSALVLGRYTIERAEPASGYFTLLVERTPYGLQIVHDHSSPSRPDPALAALPVPAASVAPTPPVAAPERVAPETIPAPAVETGSPDVHEATRW